MRSVFRRAHQRLNPHFYPTLFVNEYPKSGGTWVCQMLSEALNRRFDDNRYPRFGPCVVKLHRANFERGERIVIIRDPFDVALSFFHHHRDVYADHGFNTRAVALGKAHIFEPSMSEPDALDAFVNRITQKPIVPGFTWGEFYRTCAARGDRIIRYEDLRKNAAVALKAALFDLEIPVDHSRLALAEKKYDIETMLEERGEAPGTFFARSGKIGEGKLRLSKCARSQIKSDAGELLSQFGYQ